MVGDFARNQHIRSIIMMNVIDIAKAALTAFNEKDWSKGKGILAANAIYEEKGTQRSIQGPENIIEAWKGWAQAFPDSHGTVVSEFASGDTAVLEIIWRGTHTGPLQTPTGTIPASNKPIEMPACQILRVVDGKLQSTSHYFDMLTMLTQIGATGPRNAEA
jgi:steroid delta-isomerase-like uncharacterized protein